MALKHNELLFIPASIVVNNDDENEDDDDDDDEDECEEHKDMENMKKMDRDGIRGDGLLHKTSRRTTID